MDRQTAVYGKVRIFSKKLNPSVDSLVGADMMVDPLLRANLSDSSSLTIWLVAPIEYSAIGAVSF